MAEEKKLSEKEEAFCQSYLIDFNGARAAREAGYNEGSAKEIASQNLTKPHIQARINELREQMGKAFNITRERIAQEYARIAFFDIRKVHNDSGELLPIADLGDDEAAAIAGIEVSEFKDVYQDGKTFTSEKVKKIKISDKRAALDSLCKLMGYNEPDKKDIFLKGERPIQIIMPNDLGPDQS